MNTVKDVVTDDVVQEDVISGENAVGLFDVGLDGIKVEDNVVIHVYAFMHQRIYSRKANGRHILQNSRQAINLLDFIEGQIHQNVGVIKVLKKVSIQSEEEDVGIRKVIEIVDVVDFQGNFGVEKENIFVRVNGKDLDKVIDIICKQ